MTSNIYSIESVRSRKLGQVRQLLEFVYEGISKTEPYKMQVIAKIDPSHCFVLPNNNYSFLYIGIYARGYYIVSYKIDMKFM